LRAAVGQARWSLSRRPEPTESVADIVRAERDVFWPTHSRSRALEPTPVYDFERIGPGHEISGPAILEGADTTVVLYPDWSARMDEFGFVSLEKEDLR
jgi:N-methylhydantoinase A/oxoprolinase/acetone carboxylase beta subunit